MSVEVLKSPVGEKLYHRIYPMIGSVVVRAKLSESSREFLGAAWGSHSLLGSRDLKLHISSGSCLSEGTCAAQDYTVPQALAMKDQFASDCACTRPDSHVPEAAHEHFRLYAAVQHKFYQQDSYARIGIFLGFSHVFQSLY
jgi:hypothetical protein